MSNYSFETSKPAYEENLATNNEKQKYQVFKWILKGGNNLLQISGMMGIPQSTVSGRINDLIKEKKVEYSEFVIYKERKRKKIKAVDSTGLF
jgi:predicted transcriptional regulator